MTSDGVGSTAALFKHLKHKKLVQLLLTNGAKASSKLNLLDCVEMGEHTVFYRHSIFSLKIYPFLSLSCPLTVV